MVSEFLSEITAVLERTLLCKVVQECVWVPAYFYKSITGIVELFVLGHH